MMKKVCRSSV